MSNEIEVLINFISKISGNHIIKSNNYKLKCTDADENHYIMAIQNLHVHDTVTGGTVIDFYDIVRAECDKLYTINYNVFSKLVKTIYSINGNSYKHIYNYIYNIIFIKLDMDLIKYCPEYCNNFDCYEDSIDITFYNNIDNIEKVSKFIIQITGKENLIDIFYAYNPMIINNIQKYTNALKELFDKNILEKSDFELDFVEFNEVKEIILTY